MDEITKQAAEVAGQNGQIAELLIVILLTVISGLLILIGLFVKAAWKTFNDKINTIAKKFELSEEARLEFYYKFNEQSLAINTHISVGDGSLKRHEVKIEEHDKAIQLHTETLKEHGERIKRLRPVK